MKPSLSLPAPVGAGNPGRERLRAKLDINGWLTKRQSFHLGPEGLHCELYEFAADAPTLVFIPGIGTYAELYAEFLGKLSLRGFNVVAIDLPGHGYSGGTRGLYNVNQVCQAVSAVISHLETRFSGPFAVYGYSLGALLGVAAAEQDSRIQAVLCGTLLMPEIAPDLFHEMGWQWTHASAFFFPYAKVPLRLFVDFEYLMSNHPAGEEINKDPLVVLDYPLKTLSSVFSRRCNVRKQRYPFRSAIIHGDRDEVLPLAYSRRVVEQCEHPFELLVMERTGHMVPWMRTDALVDVAANWLLNNL